MSVPFVGIWKPCAAPLPYHIQIYNPAATHTAHAEQKGSRLIIVLYGEVGRLVYTVGYTVIMAYASLIVGCITTDG